MRDLGLNDRPSIDEFCAQPTIDVYYRPRRSPKELGPFNGKFMCDWTTPHGKYFRNLADTKGEEHEKGTGEKWFNIAKEDRPEWIIVEEGRGVAIFDSM